MDIQSYYDPKMKRLFIHEKIEITDKFIADPETESHINFYTESLNERLDKPAFFADCELDARFSRVRTEETNLGNFCADLMRTELETDFALSNGGCLRANCLFEQGK